MAIKMEQITEIGKVKLDYKHYPGQELYSDGDIEEQLLEIVKNHSRVEFPRIIEESGSWPILYHLSALRSNIIEWLPITREHKVLEIGAGCGAITDMLARKAGQVVSVDLSSIRSRINAYRNQDRDNVYIHVGNFKDIEPELPTDFDFILLIGVFEYSCLYMGTDTPYEDMLRIMQKHLKKDGRLVIAIENKFGLKYWAGCTEDHLGTYFSGIEGYPEGGSARTFTRKGLEKIMNACDISEYTFYYPYPDYKFMTTLYSDKRLPVKGELTDNIRNFDRNRMVLFHEKYAYDGIIDDGLFPDFSNSYVVVIGKEPETVYVKYSNDRAAEYVVRTEIKERDGLAVYKTALSEEARAHVKKMEATYHTLSEKYEGSGLAVNRCQNGEDGESAVFEYIEGTTLEELMDRCLEKGDMEGFQKLFDRFLKYVYYGQENALTNYDFIFSNILVSGVEQEQWTLIDYEWVEVGEVSPAEIAFRAVYCYILAEEKRNKLNLELIMEKIGISPEDAEEYRDNEKKFQKLVTGKRKSLGDIRATCGTQVLDPQKLVQQYMDGVLERRVQIYFDRGQGFNEEESCFIPDVYHSDKDVRFELSVDGNVQTLRLDPANEACVVQIKQLLWNGEVILPVKKNISTNGKQLKEGCYVFATEDPNIYLPVNLLERKAENLLEAELEIIKMPVELADSIAASIKKLF